MRPWVAAESCIPHSPIMNPFFLRPLRLLYALMRRLSIMDITRLMHLRESDFRQQSLAPGYSIRTIGASELSRLYRAGRVPAQIGKFNTRESDHRAIVAVFHCDRVVSFVWFARHSIKASDNFSRAEHLGTSIDLPVGTAFIFNAWTDPDHRGKRLVASVLAYAVHHRVVGACSLLTTVDWTNLPSLRAFEFIGMKRLGTIVRFGRGSLQLSVIPQVARLGLRIARDAPGYKMAV